MYEGLLAETVRFTGHDGDEIDAYFARPLAVASTPGVVVIHHMPGWDEGTKEFARKFAHHGYAAKSYVSGATKLAKATPAKKVTRAAAAAKRPGPAKKAPAKKAAAKKAAAKRTGAAR